MSIIIYSLIIYGVITKVIKNKAIVTSSELIKINQIKAIQGRGKITGGFQQKETAHDLTIFNQRLAHNYRFGGQPGNFFNFTYLDPGQHLAKKRL